MKDCTTCKYERPLMYCRQGHVRKLKYFGDDNKRDGTYRVVGHEPIENCHGWEEKKSCWCKGKNGSRAFALVDRSRIEEDLIFPKFCPECGEKLK